MRGWSVLRDVVDTLPLATQPSTVRLIIGMQGLRGYLGETKHAGKRRLAITRPGEADSPQLSV